MGFNEEYLKLRKKRLEEDEEEKSSVPYQRPLNNSAVVPGNSYLDRVMSGDVDDIAPLPSKSSKEEEKDRKWFDKGAFDDGYQFGDVTKSILGTAADLSENLGAGLIGIGEKAVDALVTISPYIAQGQYYQNGGGYNVQADQAFQQAIDESKAGAKEFVKKDLYNEEDIAKTIVGGITFGYDYEADSIAGEKLDSLAQSAGQLAGTAALQAVGIPWWLTTGVTSFGSESENALNSGATLEEAALSGFVTAGAEILTEKISGGISFGGKTLDSALTKQLAVGISNKTVRTLTKFVGDAAGEGFEEILSGVMSAIGQKLTYADDKEINELFSSEEAFESFIGGAVLGGGSSAINAIKGKVNGVDPVTEFTKNEQAVFDKVYNTELEAKAEEKGGKLTNKEKSEIYDKVMNDFEKGYISTDTIEEVLGGEDYTNYQNELKRQQDIDNELNELRNMKSGDMTDIQMERMAELKGMKPNTELVNSLKFGIDEKIRNSIQGTRLVESYNERARRGQTFEADLSKYDTKQQEVIKKAIESGILNNTNRTHEFVDMVAKISADKGVLFDFANNAKLKESGFGVNGKFVNGYVTKDGITVNIDSQKALNSIVGHEITHVLEGTELYAALKVSITEYARSRGDYQSRIDALTKLYEGVEGADVTAELTADLVGDYLFTDSDFINHLSTTNRNVFQRIFDEIKYLYKVATAGSKQARELEKVKRAFENAYRESGRKNTAKESGAKYSLSETTDGRFVAVVDSDILSNIDTSSWDKTKKNEAKKAASEALKKFNEGIVVDGITRKVNKISRNEYTRSNYTESLYLNNPDVFADKMRAADVVDDIVVAATNWNRDGALTHSRNDNFVDFDHGQTLIMSGDSKYSAEVVIGITSDGDAVFYDVVDMTPTTFEIKKAESSTAATTQDAIGDIHEDSADAIIPQNYEKSIENTKFSLSDSEGRKLTKKQADYFKDSKIRDENGNLKVMYHGSSETFTVFDKSKAKSSGTYGKGFYFTDSTSHAATYGKTYGVYLNITNPIQNGTNDITKEQIRKFVEVLAENEDYGIDNYGYDATIDSVTDSVWGKSDFGMILDLNISCVGNMVEAIELFNEVNGTNYNGIVAPTETVAFYPNQIKNIDNANPTENPDIRYSLSDSEGKKLTNEQREYFKDSKMRDDNGNLKVMYHGSQDAGFHIFDPAHSDDDTSLFFVDRNDVATSYSGTSETYAPKAFKSVQDANKFFAEINATEYKVVENEGKYTLLEDGDEVATSDDLAEIYEEWRDWSGLGYGDANYKVYLNLTNPLIVDAEGRNWNNISREYSQEIADRYHSLTANERAALTDLAEWGEYGIFKDEMLAAAKGGSVLASANEDIDVLAKIYEKLGGANTNLYDAFSIASENFSEESIKQFAVKQFKTRDYAQKAKAEGYDGVIFKNIHDNGGYSNGDEGASTVAIAFESNQIKSVANDKPTADKDIRYSLSETDKTYLEAVKRGDMETAQQMVYDAAKQAGYTDDMSYKMQHSAPNSKDDVSLYDLKKSGLVPNDYWNHPEWYTYGAEERESFYKVKDALSKQERWDAEGKTNYKGEPAETTIWVYRAVDKTVNSKEDHFRNGDWVTPSYDYAVNEGQMNPNGYRIIKQRVSIKNLYWDGNSIAELGYDDGNNYAYRDTVNNRKLLDPVTYDNYGMVIPLSKRFKYRNSDTRYSLSDTNEAPTKKYGNYNVYGKDIGLPVEDDIAPVGVAENAITTEEADYLPEDYSPIENSYTIEQELDDIQSEINALVEEGTALYNNGEEEAATRVMLRINELSDKARTLTERSNTLRAQEEAERSAYIDSITDADMPIDTESAYSEAETTPLDEKTLKKLTKGVRDALSCMPKESEAIREVIEKYSTSNQTKSELFKVLKEKFGDKYEYHRYTDIAEVKKHLRNTKFTISDHVKSDIADFSDYKKQHGIRNSKNALSVDVVYEELVELYPGLFPSDIANETDRLERIAEVLAMPSREWVKVAELSDNEIMQAVDFIHNEVVGYRNTEARKAAEANARAYIDDIAPSRAREITENVSDPTLRYQGIHRETPIKTVKERIAEKLSNVEKELADNKRLRADSIVDFNREIADLQEEYNSKANKNTKVANDILRRIERLQRMKNNVDADFEKSISDLEAKKAKLSEETRTGTSATEQAIMRAELHLSKIDNIRAKFTENGLDFDKALKNAKDLSTIATNDNTPQRVMEKALGYREGQILADETVNKVAQNETEGIKWLNSYTDRKNGLIAKISKQYNIKPGSKESAAAQMYAEGFYVNKNEEIIKYGDNELAIDFPDAKVQANIKGLARDPRIRQIYDETLDMINESRARNAYPEIQKLDNYFLHFRAMDDTFSRLGLPFNPNDITANDLPTDLNGVTADLKPGQPYFASSMHREGIKTSYDLLGGLERYLSSAKNQIYHIDDIQTLRALRNYIADTYGQAKGLESLDALSEEEAQERIKQVFKAHLSTFAKFLNEEANVIAGKTALIDRGFEGLFGRRAMTFMNTLNKQVGANMVGFNVSSSLTNFIAPVQAFAKTNKAAFVKGFAQTVSNKLGSIVGKTDGFAESSPVIIRRKGAERFYRTPFQKVSDAGYVLMSAVDDISTEIIARAKYNELTAKGMSAEQAHVETDKWVSRLMGDRSLGQMPQLYNSKTLGLITKFQLEVRNQLDSQFYDTIQETKANNADIENALVRNSKTAAKVALVFTELAIAQHLFGKAFESIAGYNPTFDIIDVLIKMFGFDDDEESEDTIRDNIEQGFLALLEDLPYSSTLTGGRIPISSALPITELIKGEDEYGNEKSRLETLGEIAPYYVLPGGYGQVRKTIQGLGMFSDKHPIAGSYTDSGNLRFPVDETLGNVAQAAIFGQWASDNARDYFDNERAPLKEKQIQEFIDVGMTIQDYWNYREGLSKYKTMAEKADYIYGLDLTDEQKNVLINNIADREENIDMSDYGNYDSFEEFDYANKNPEKYEFWKQNGISYKDYASGDEDTKAAYNWAYENPDKFTLSKAVASDVVTYRQYTKELYDLKADKDEDGKTITGSRKEKVIDYVNNLDIDYGSRIILFKSEYPADDTYNYDIIDYLNNREDISYSEMVTILKELGFTVDSKGNITWE